MVRSTKKELNVIVKVIEELFCVGMKPGRCIHLNAQAWPRAASPILEPFGAVELHNPSSVHDYRLTNIQKVHRCGLERLQLERRYDLILATHTITSLADEQLFYLFNVIRDGLKGRGQVVIVEEEVGAADAERLITHAGYVGLQFQDEVKFHTGSHAGFLLAFSWKLIMVKVVRDAADVMTPKKAVEKKEADVETTKKEIEKAQALMTKELEEAIDWWVANPEKRGLLVHNTEVNPLLQRRPAENARVIPHTLGFQDEEEESESVEYVLSHCTPTEHEREMENRFEAPVLT